jgi:hypothetical protein
MEDGKKLLVVGLVTAAVVLLFRKKAGAIPPADIQLSNLVISPTEVYVGQPVSISVDATNIGQTAGSYTVTMEVT